MFSNASNFTQGVDMAFLIILSISFFFLIGITALMIYFVIKYNRKKNIHAVQIKDNPWVEATWTTVPLILVLLMFYYGYIGYLPMKNPPKDAMQITVIGKMWKWTFEYQGGKQSDTLYVPVNKAIKLNLVSEDVLHGFYVPAFRIKDDVVPGKANYSWFIAQQQGEYEVLCSSYCGIMHSYMGTDVKVVTEPFFKSWLARLPVKKVVKDNAGLAVMQKNGCLACHSLDGTKILGPSFKGLYGTTIDVITNGKTRKVVVDDEYIKTSILEPNQDIAAGFNAGIMKAYGTKIKPQDIKKIANYLKSMNAK
jgi:cytochrome c oxidase subunit 2